MARGQAGDPATHAVTGGVVAKDGRPVVRGAIQFVGVGDTSFPSIGEIGSDGTFALRTNLADGRTLAGAVSGTYRVTIFPPADAPLTEPLISPPQPYRVTAGDNQLTIQLE